MRVWVATMLAALAAPGLASAGTVFLLDGQGWGHGVGMSQWGAEGYARHGYGYRQILAHYYLHTQIARAQPRAVRVLLAEKQATVRISSSAPFLVVDARGQKRHLRALVVSKAVRKSMRLPVHVVPGAQPLGLGGAAYRGDIVVKRKPAGLMAVNVVPLDRYLRGVVPWEVPKAWHEATYEAQAVAARSYTLATMHPSADFDLYPDDRSQMYGGVRAERPETNLAVGATAGQVLEWDDRIIPAYYFSTSGGRTSSIHDAWPQAHQVPYLVSVPDRYDSISPRHAWPTALLTPARVAHVLHLDAVRDVRATYNGSRRVKTLRVLTAQGWKTYDGQTIRNEFSLGSTDFQVHAMSLSVPRRTLEGARVHAHGWVRGLAKVLLQEQTSAGWRTVRRIHAARNGAFSVTLPARSSTSLRLSAEGLAGPPAALHVAAR
jgi:stage II sporulation protein D